MSNRNPILIGQAEEIDLVQPHVRAMLENPGVYIAGDTEHPDYTIVLVVTEPGTVHAMSPDDEPLAPERFLPTVTLRGPYRADEPDEAETLRARNAELELACAQAVEFATYVEEHAKGKMEEAARRFLSMEFAQELAGVIKAGRAAVKQKAAVSRLKEALDAAGNKDLRVLSAEFEGDMVSASIVDEHEVKNVGAWLSDRRTLAHFGAMLVAQHAEKGNG